MYLSTLVSPPKAHIQWRAGESYFFFAVLAARLKLAAVGAPLAPGFLIFSPLPAAILFFLALMLAYKPRFAGMINTSSVVGQEPS